MSENDKPGHLQGAGGFRSRSKQAGPRRKPSGARSAAGRDAQRGRSRDRDHAAKGRRGGSRGADRGRKPARGREKRERTDRRRGGAQRRAFEYRGLDVPRQVAFETLLAVAEDAAYANLQLPAALKKRRLTGRDAAFATEITYGALRNQGVIDAVLADCSSRKLSDVAPTVLAALRLGCYQVLYTRVDDHAAVDTTVRLVTATPEAHAKGFTNAVMRAITRRSPEEWLGRLSPKDEPAATAFRAAHPEWIARSFARSLAANDAAEPGLEELSRALEADSERPRVHLAALPGRMTAEELALVSGGEEAHFSPYGVYLDEGDPGELDAVSEGLAIVQDEGSQLIARGLAEAPTEGPDSGRWLDLCAGPGGKAALIGSIAKIAGAKLTAVEPAAHRARLVREACQGLPVDVVEADGRDTGLKPGFDRILVDAPCSGLGALRRRPEARWRKEENDVEGLSALQYELLDAALGLVRPGGVVVYSTCSPDIRETREVVDRALGAVGDWEIDAHALAPKLPGSGRLSSAQLWPHRHGTDAMFFAALRRPLDS